MNSSAFENCIFPVAELTVDMFASDTFSYTSKVSLVINFVSLPVCVIGNLLVLLAILTTPSLQKPANIIIGSLALVDFLVGVVLQPFFAFLILNTEAIFHCRYVDACIACSYAMASCSVTSMALVSLERYVALFYPLRYTALVTNERSYLAWFLAWIIPISNTALSVYSFTIGLVIGPLVYSLSLTAIAIVYLKIHLLVRRHRRQIQSQQMATASAERASQTKLKK